VSCHGGKASKNSLNTALICELLSKTYDVIAFALRGHIESWGDWTSDLATAEDAGAVAAYAQQCDHDIKALFGMFMGAWVALLDAAINRNVDVVEAVSPSPTTMRAVAGFSETFGWGMEWWSAPVRWAVGIVLGARFLDNDEDISQVDYVSQTEGILVL
jgi:pimeloyl-ACP methyl ester carboxylesterase